jgi:hypothetical protein
MPNGSRSTDLDYHLRRARSERNIAYRVGDCAAADAHMRLSALHLRQALVLQALQSGPVGNVHPFRQGSVGGPSPVPAPMVELPSAR